MSRFEWLALAGTLILSSAAGIALSLLYPPFALPISLGIALVSIVFILWRAMRQRALEHAQLDARARVEQAITAARDLDASLSRALDAILDFTHAAAGRIWLGPFAAHALDLQLQRGLFPATAPRASDTAPAARAADSHQIIYLTDLAELPAFRELGLVELVCVPLCVRARAVGVLEIGARHRGALNPPTRQWLATVAPLLALVVDARQQTARAADAERLRQAGLEVASVQEYARVLRTIVDRARELIGGEASAVCMWDEQKRWWVVQGTSGASDAFEVSVQRPAPRADDRPAGCPVIRFKYRQAHLDVPLVRAGQVVGCLCIANQNHRVFSDAERSLLANIADQAALAVEHARRFEQAGSRAATTERERLARELHDTLAQLLGFVNVKTLTVREYLAQGQVDAAQTQLEQLAALAQELYADTRELILGLGTETGPAQGLLPALHEYVERFSQLSGVAVALGADGFQDMRFTPTVELQLVRVVQEALSNVRKHARAQHAWVRFERAGEHAHLQIEDDGRGFDPANLGRGLYPRFGLQSMRERVESIGGEFAIHSTPGQGTTVAIQIPIVYRGEGT